MKDRASLRCVLIQAREDVETIQEEQEEFASFAGIDEAQLDTLNIFTTRDFPEDILDEYDVIFVGGSSGEGDDVVDWKKPYILNTGAVLRRAYERKVPTFASCFGFQVAAVVLGGTLIKDPEHMEMGSYPIYLTDEGKKDVLFHDLPDGFLAISGHSKRVSVLPPGAVSLAYSDLCSQHAFVMADAPFYGTQFHPELTDERLKGRITRYQKVYLDGDDHLERVKRDTKPTPESNKLIGRFMERIVLG